MHKTMKPTVEKNLISKQLIALRKKHGLSQRDLANKLQLAGYMMDKNVITRIETNKRHVTDIELKAFTEVFHVSYEELLGVKRRVGYRRIYGTINNKTRWCGRDQR